MSFPIALCVSLRIHPQSIVHSAVECQAEQKHLCGKDILDGKRIEDTSRDLHTHLTCICVKRYENASFWDSDFRTWTAVGLAFCVVQRMMQMAKSFFWTLGLRGTSEKEEKQSLWTHSRIVGFPSQRESQLIF